MTFSSIVGHDQQKEILRRAVASDHLAHAYLFEGPEGIGKRLMAMALARAIVCEDGTGCGDCSACRKIDHNNHPDLHILEADGAGIKIEQVRRIQKELSLRPLECSYKICLIDGADLLTKSAANALLKTLEEPQGKTLLILLTDKPEALLDTIRSRCQKLPFQKLERSKLSKILVQRLGINDVEAEILAALSEGSFKKAFGEHRDLYLQQRKELINQLTALSRGSIFPLLDLAQKLSDDKENLPQILEIYQTFFRDLLLLKQGCQTPDLVNQDMLEKLHRHADQESTGLIMKKLVAIEESRHHIQRNVNRLLAMETMLMRISAGG